MSRKRYGNMRNDTSDYSRGYTDGLQAAFDSSELDAYYAGVGFGKYAAGDKHLGFNSAEEKAEFEKGISNKDNHFKSYRAQPSTFWERLFGKKISSERINYSTKRDNRKAARKTKKASRKTARLQKRSSRKSKGRRR